MADHPLMHPLDVAVEYDDDTSSMSSSTSSSVMSPVILSASSRVPIPVPKDLENLVFRGGGIKGLAYCGALDVLHSLGALHNIQRYAGSSAGAITAALLAVGYTTKELEGILRITNFKVFKDTDSTIVNPFKTFGMYKGKVFLDWMGDLLKNKTGNPDITFKQVKDEYKKELVVVGTCLTHLEAHYFSPYSDPNVSVRHAVRIIYPCSSSQ
eukprot:TRINITY_DN22918_c0_g1_i1.p1 TRINITY_DN22918_c0_g1~~TRINITY_DN22918_c0_g1_i1.p1  ORF type:complete len:211 (-),score=53.93 TRINITY_DN22918_c0_g1_i1:735-1367(-)